jgi:hypothetical protein
VAALASQANNLVSQAQALDIQIAFIDGQLTGTGSGSASGSASGAASGSGSASGSGTGSATIQQEVAALSSQANNLVSQAQALDIQIGFIDGQLTGIGGG